MTDTTEILRRLENLIRLGTVEEVRHTRPARVRVKTGGVVTGWVTYAEQRAGETLTWNPPTIGEQVVLLSPGGDLSAAVAFTAVNQEQKPAPSDAANETVTVYPDGGTVKYDHASGAMSITGIKSLYIEAADSVHIKTQLITLDAPQSISTGKHTVEGLLTYQAGMSGKNGGGNSTSITGDLTHQTGNLSSNGVVLHTHVHGGVLSGGSDTAGPK